MLSQQLYQAFSGQVVQRYQRNSDKIEVKVRYSEPSRANPADVLPADIRTADNTVLPLDSVATVTYGYTRDMIDRIDGKRAVYVSSDIDKDMLSATELVPQLKRRYPGLDVHFAGEAEHSMINMFLMPILGEKTRQARFLIPAAVSLGYGIMFATVITLILIPSLLMIHLDAVNLLERIRGKMTATGRQAKATFHDSAAD